MINLWEELKVVDRLCAPAVIRHVRINQNTVRSMKKIEKTIRNIVPGNVPIRAEKFITGER